MTLCNNSNCVGKVNRPYQWWVVVVNTEGKSKQILFCSQSCMSVYWKLYVCLLVGTHKYNKRQSNKGKQINEQPTN